MDFSRELGTFQVHLMELLAHEGAFVAILGDEIKGPFETPTKGGHSYYS